MGLVWMLSLTNCIQRTKYTDRSQSIIMELQCTLHKVWITCFNLRVSIVTEWGYSDSLDFYTSKMNCATIGCNSRVSTIEQSEGVLMNTTTSDTVICTCGLYRAGIVRRHQFEYDQH